MMTPSRRFALRCALVSSALALVWTAAACEPKQAPATKPAAETPAADKPAAETPAAEKPAAETPPATEKPAGDDGAAAAADTKGGAAPTLPLGQNDPSFFEGIEGEGQLWTTIETSMGTFTCKLHEKETPNTVANFVGLARGKKAFVDPETQQPTLRPFYDGIAFHRVIPKFMVQIGDPTGTGRYNPGYRFNDEIVPDLKHVKGGILSMANAGPGTNGSQFFITETATPHLDGRHTVFGECNEVDLVREIAAVPTGPGNKPLQPVKIVSVKFMRKAS